MAFVTAIRAKRQPMASTAVRELSKNWYPT